MDPIKIDPLEFNWRLEWLPRAKQKLWRGCKGPHEIVEAISRWTRETDAWLAGLSDKKKRDVVALLSAECDLLWWHPTDALKQGVSWAREDFRERWFQAIPLLRAAVRLRLVGIEPVERDYRRLEDKAHEVGWLP